MSEDPHVGYGQPPVASRFQKGRSGNPRGRPKGRKSTIPYDAVLGQEVTIREDGRERRVSAAEAFLLQLAKKGLEGDGGAARASLTAIEEARERRLAGGHEGVTRIVICFVGFSANWALEPLADGAQARPLSPDCAHGPRALDRRGGTGAARPTAHAG